MLSCRKGGVALLSEWDIAGIEKAIENGGWFCQDCLRELEEQKAKRHHLWPKTLGGESIRENCWIRCHICEKNDPHWIANNRNLVLELLAVGRYGDLLAAMLLNEDAKRAKERLPHVLSYYRELVISKKLERDDLEIRDRTFRRTSSDEFPKIYEQREGKIFVPIYREKEQVRHNRFFMPAY